MFNDVRGCQRYIHGALVLVLITFLAGPLRAQQNKIDSLKSLISPGTRDTVAVNTLLLLTRQLYWAAHYDESLKYAKQARELAATLSFARAEGDAWIASGHTWLRKGKYDSALRHFDHARKIFVTSKNYRSLATSYLFTGQAHDYRAEYNEALQYYKMALSLIEVYPDDAILFKILNSTGITNFNKGNYETALEYYHRSLKISEQFNDKLYYATALNNIGVVHVSIYQYEDALQYFLRYLKTVRELKHTNSIAVALLNVGETYNNLRRHQQGLHYLDSALTIYEQMNDKRGLSLTHSNLGDACRHLHRYSQAENHYHHAITIATEIKSDEALIKGLIGIAELYITTGDTSKAALHLADARAAAERTGSMLWLEKAYLFSSRLDSARGNYKDAYQWFKRYSALNDSLFSERKSQQVVQMSERYESEKKDKEIRLLSEAKKLEEIKLSSNKKVLWISVIFFIVIIAGILWWVYIQSRHSKVLQAKNERISYAYRELKVLMDKVEDQNKMLAQKNDTLEDLHREKDGLIGVVAHDLRSPLNRITGLTQILAFDNNLSSEQKDVVGIIQKVCKDGNGLIRDLLDINQYENTEALDITSINLVDHISGMLNHYTPHLHKKDLKMFFEYETPLILTTDAGFLNRILDNIITNAIKFSPFGRNIYVKVLKEKQDPAAKIIIQDEGPGFHADDLPHLFRKFKKLSARPTAGESSTGLGLSIVKSLVDKVKGSITVESTWGKGASFIISLPLEINASPPETVILKAGRAGGLA